MVPDFDRFERLMKAGIVASSASQRQDFAREMAELELKNQPSFAKRRTSEELDGWLCRARAALTQSFPSGEQFVVGSNNNQEGKDLLAIPSRRPVELKCDPKSATDANIGIGPIATLAFGDNDQYRLYQIMVEPTVERRRLWASIKDTPQRDKAITLSKAQTMDALFKYLNTHFSEGYEAPATLGQFVKAIAIGYTNEETIRAFAKGTPFPAPLLLGADWESGLRPYTRPFQPNERVLVEQITRSAKRTTLLLRGERSRLSAEIYAHFKNSYHGPLPGGGVGDIPCANWVRTPCFHVWIREERADKKTRVAHSL